MFPSLEEIKKRANGTYVCLNASEKSSEQLESWAKSHKIPDPNWDHHITVTYSRKPVPEVENYKFKLPISVKISEWKLFNNPDGSKCLVGVIEDKRITKHHQNIKDIYGATHDFNDYTPHITMSYKYSLKNLPTELPDFEIVLDSVKIEPLEE